MDKYRSGINPGNRNNGRALVEVLVAVTLMASVLSGFAALQSRAIGFSALAGFRSLAVLSASDIVERMRANPDGARNGSYEFNAVDRTPRGDCSIRGSNCSSSEIAAVDLWAWSDRISRTLPDGIGRIKYMSDAPAGTYRVIVGWTHNSGAGASSENSPTECDRELHRVYCYVLEVIF